MKQAHDTQGRKLILVAYVLLVGYNLVFFLGKFGDHPATRPFTLIHQSLMEFKGMMTFLEFLGVASVFIDLITRFEEIKRFRGWRVLLTALLASAFIFKLFVNYLDSAYA